MVAVPQTVRMK